MQNNCLSPASTELKPKQELNFNTLSAQRTRILGCLRQYGTISTSEAREEQGIMHPAGRIRELRLMGYVIKCDLKNYQDTAGINHKMGIYTLISEPVKGVCYE